MLSADVKCCADNKVLYTRNSTEINPGLATLEQRITASLAKTILQRS